MLFLSLNSLIYFWENSIIKVTDKTYVQLEVQAKMPVHIKLNVHYNWTSKRRFCAPRALPQLLLLWRSTAAEEDVTCNARSGRKKNVHRKKCRLTSLYCQRMKNTIQLFPAQIANCQMKRNSQCVICIITCLICLLDGLDETLPWHGDYLMKALLDSLQISKANLSLSDLACSSLGRANKAKKSRSFGSCCSGSSSRTEKYKQTIRNE